MGDSFFTCLKIPRYRDADKLKADASGFNVEAGIGFQKPV